MVVPTIREDCIREWLAAWAGDLAGARVIVVEDNPAPSFTVTGAEHYSHRDFAGLGADSWIIPRRTRALPALARPLSRRRTPLSSGEPVRPA